MVYVHLSRLLGERKMQQAELARLTGIRPNTINDLYHGTGDRISLDHLDRICEALDCPLHELLERKPGAIHKTGREVIVEAHGRRKKPKR